MSDPRKIDDSAIIAEAIRLVSEGVSVTFPVNGRSMLPFIVGGRDSVILEQPTDLRWGDIVLALVENGKSKEKFYVVHRVLSLDGDRVILMGDGNLALREFCDRADVCAKVVQVVRGNGKKCSINSFGYRLAAKVWFALLPFRRYFLWLYRKVH